MYIYTHINILKTVISNFILKKENWKAPTVDEGRLVTIFFYYQDHRVLVANFQVTGKVMRSPY